MRHSEQEKGQYLQDFFERPLLANEIRIRNEVMQNNPDKAFLPLVYYMDWEHIRALTILNAVLSYEDQWTAGNIVSIPDNFFVLDLQKYSREWKLYDLKTGRSVLPQEIKLANGENLSELIKISGTNLDDLFVREWTAKISVGLWYFSVGVDEIIISNGQVKTILTTRDNATWSDDNKMTWVAGRLRFGDIKIEMVEEWLEERIRWKVSSEGEIIFLVPELKDVFPGLDINEAQIKEIIIAALKKFIEDKLNQVNNDDFESLFKISKEEFKQIFGGISPDKVKLEFFNVEPIDNIVKDKGRGIGDYAVREIVVDGESIGRMPVYYDFRTAGWEIRKQVILPEKILNYPPLFSESSVQKVKVVAIQNLSEENVVPYVWILSRYLAIIVSVALGLVVSFRAA